MDNDKIYRMHCYIPKFIYYNAIEEAKRQNIFVEADGHVNIGALLAELVFSFSEGRSKIIKRPDAIATESALKIE